MIEAMIEAIVETYQSNWYKWETPLKVVRKCKEDLYTLEHKGKILFTSETREDVYDFLKANGMYKPLPVKVMNAHGETIDRLLQFWEDAINWDAIITRFQSGGHWLIPNTNNSHSCNPSTQYTSRGRDRR
jgi:hypothetical protein